MVVTKDGIVIIFLLIRAFRCINPFVKKLKFLGENVLLHMSEYLFCFFDFEAF